MEMHKIAKAHGKEIALAAVVLGGLGTAIGIAIRKNAHRLEEKRDAQAKPEILMSDDMVSERKERLNNVAAYILLHDTPTRKDIMAALNLTKSHAQDAIGYLKDNRLVTRTGGVMPNSQHYVATPDLVLAAIETAKNENKFPELHKAVEEIRDLPSDNL